MLNSTGIITFIAASLMQLWPSHISGIKVRHFNIGAVISLNKSSPPLAILMDSQLRGPSETKQTSSRELQRLVPVERSMVIKNLSGIKITRQEKIEKPKFQIRSIDKVNVVRLEPATTPVAPQAVVNKNKDLAQVTFSEWFQRSFVDSSSAAPATKAEAAVKPQPIKEEPGAVVAATPSSRVDNKKDRDPVSVIKKTKYRIIGDVLLSGGAALLPGTTLMIGRESDGLNKETAAIDLKNNRFEILIDDLKGFIVGRILDKDVQVLSQGQLWLDKLPQKSGKIIAGVTLELKPRAVAYADRRTWNNSGEPVGGVRVSTNGQRLSQKTDVTGQVFLAGLDPKSQMVLTSQKQGYVPTISIFGGEVQNDSMIYSQEFVDRFMRVGTLTRAFAKEEQKSSGLLLGRVIVDEKLMAGAVVELAESEDVIGPIYFDDNGLPDDSLTSTGASGLYGFLRVRPGVNAVRARLGDKYLPSEVIHIEPQMVTHQDVKLTPKEVKSAIVIDAFSGQRLASEIRFAGSEKTLITRGQFRLGLNLEKPNILESVPQNTTYMPETVNLDKNQKNLVIPHVPYSWFDSLKLNRRPDTGVVIGFISGNNYDVFMDVNGQAHNDIIFFSPYGEVVSSPVEGGGFVIYNLSPGLRTVSLIPRGSDKITNVLAVVTKSQISIIKKDL